MFDFTPDQIKSALRWLVTTFGGVVAGFFAAKGWINADTVMGILNSPTFIGVAASGIGLVLSWISHSKVNTVASANALPEVAGVVTMPTADGRALATAVPSNTVAAAGTADAKAVASTGTPS